MKSFSKVILLSGVLCSLAYAQWTPQVSGTNYALKSVYFVDENTGFACGFYQVLKTTNGGANWQISQVPGRHNSLYFVDENTGFLSSDSGKIYKTINSGVIWTPVNSGTPNNLMRIEFINGNTGLVVGYKRTVLKTTDSGESWFSVIANLDTLDFYGCTFINENNYMVVGTNSSIYRSTNAGASWLASTLGFVNPLWAPDFINDNTGWITGCCGIFIKTTNAGLTWSPDIYLTLGHTIYTMKFINSTTGYMCGDGGILYRTTNQGENWDSTITGGTYQILYSLFMVNENTGWVVGGFGTILKTTNGGGPGFPIGIKQISSEIPSEFSLSQNYPNPFNPITNFKFQISDFGFVNLKIYDINGKEINRLINQQLSAGVYEVSWDASGYPSGVYFYRVSVRQAGSLTGDYSSTKKMILIK